MSQVLAPFSHKISALNSQLTIAKTNTYTYYIHFRSHRIDLRICILKVTHPFSLYQQPAANHRFKVEDIFTCYFSLLLLLVLKFLFNYYFTLIIPFEIRMTEWAKCDRNWNCIKERGGRGGGEKQQTRANVMKYPATNRKTTKSICVHTVHSQMQE